MILKNKRAAMEMTVGTMITIVLLVAVLVMVLFFITKIRESGVRAIEGVDSAMRAQIDKLFAEDSTKKIVIYPATKQITIKKGEANLGFGFAIRNIGSEEDRFSYDITATEEKCGMRLTEQENLIALGKNGKNILIQAGTIMDDPIFVRFNIPDNAPPCNIRYAVDMQKSGEVYGSTIYVDLIIEGK